MAMEDSDSKIYLWLLLLAAIVAAGWYFRDAWLPPADVAAPTIPATEETAPEVKPVGPQHPIEVADEDLDTHRTLQPLPPLDDSDAYFLLELGSVFGADIEALLLREGVIDRLVASIDNLSRKHVSHRIRPVGNLATPFVANETDDESRFTLGPENFRRYDLLVGHIAGADLEQMADMYRRYYPLFQESYVRLGYPNAYFNDRLIEVIDLLLDTPQPGAPLTMTRPNVLYEFADPELERLSSGQKLLLRMGNDNATTIKQVLRDFRERIARSETR